MATLITEDFEGAASGTTITGSNTAFNGFIAGTPTFDSSIAVSGTRSAHFDPVAAQEYVSTTFTATATWSIRFYANFAAIPAATSYICTVLSGATTMVQVGINSNGTVRIRGGVGGTTLQATTTAALTAGTWYRFEWQISSTTGTQALRIFTGNSTTAISGADISGTGPTGTVDRFLLGLPVSGTITWNADAVLSTDTAAFLGPIAGGTSNLLVDAGTHIQTAHAAAGFGQGGFGAGGFGGGGDIPLSQAQSNLLVDSAVHLQVAISGGLSDVVVTPQLLAAPVTFATPIVEVGFSTDPTINGGVYGHWGDPQRGIWGQSLWAPAQLWSDVTGNLQTFSFQRGATRDEGPVLRYEAGTATIVFFDFDGRFNPLNTTGPYSSAGVSQVRPMVAVRIRAAFGGTVRDLWRGFADGWQIEYPSLTHARVTLTATDAQKVLSRHNRPEGPLVGAAELPGKRVNRILDSVGWPKADRIVETGQTPLQPTTLSGSAWDELLLVQDTELGEVFVNAEGKVVFRGRYSVVTRDGSVNSQGTFGSDRAGGELPYANVTPSYDDSTIFNVIRIGRAGGTAQEARDDTSVAAYLESVHERTDLLMQTDTEAASYAHYLLSQAKDPELLFTDVAVDPRAQPADLFPQVLDRDFADRITLHPRPPGLGLVERQVLIRGISGDYGGTGRWQWKWALQPADVMNYGVWGNPNSKWGSARWTY